MPRRRNWGFNLRDSNLGFVVKKSRVRKKLRRIQQVPPIQRWQDSEYCRQYAETWEISTREVHYGWLAPGENTLRLLREINLERATILDVGCGMGENLASLSRQKAKCFGIDISRHMLRYARNRDSKIQLAQEDMRLFSAFPGVLFDAILSVYSLEYLDSLQEFRDVLATLFQRLRPGGIFVFCFSHPLQHYRHSMLRNESAQSGSEQNSPLIYSFKDVVLCLNETGFTIDRILEQQTPNPSTMTYENGQVYPYHFHEGKNPCSAEFDKLSNSAPHTIIYKVKKPETGIRLNRQLTLNMRFGGVRIWGEARRVIDSISFKYKNQNYIIRKLEPKDAVVGVCHVSSFQIDGNDIKKSRSVRIPVHGPIQLIQSNSLLGIIFRRAKVQPLNFSYHQDWLAVPEQHGKLLYSVYISRIDPIFGEFLNVFPKEEIGVLIFVNGAEPGAGKVALQNFFPSLHDRIDVVYIACDRQASEKKEFIRDDSQLTLFAENLFEMI